MLGANRRHVEQIAFDQFDSIVFRQHAGRHHHLVAVCGDLHSRRYECALMRSGADADLFPQRIGARRVMQIGAE